MRSCVADRQTDRQTDGAGYIGPADRQGGSKKTLLTRVDETIVTSGVWPSTALSATFSGDLTNVASSEPVVTSMDTFFPL